MQAICKQKEEEKIMKVWIDNRDFKVYLSITHKRKRFYVFTGLQTTEKFNGMVFPKSDKSAKSKTNRLAQIYKLCDDYINTHNEESPNDIKEHLKDIIIGKKRTKNNTIIAVINKFCETKDKQGTVMAYKRLITDIRAYDADATLDGVDFDWVSKFYKHEEEKGRCNNGIIGDIDKLKAVFNWARRNKLTTNFPFERAVFKKDRTRKRNLSVEQLRKVRDIGLDAHDVVYRDFFMLGFYLIGMNLSDILDLKKADYKDGRISFYRNKTNRLYDIKVEPEAKSIIEKYTEKDPKKDNLLDFLKVTHSAGYAQFNTKCNHCLRSLGKRAYDGKYYDFKDEAIEPDLTSYWNRHTWATLAAKIGIPMEIIGRALGHSIWDNSITGVYVEYDIAKIDEANRKVIDYLNEDLKCNKDTK